MNIKSNDREAVEAFMRRQARSTSRPRHKSAPKTEIVAPSYPGLRLGQIVTQVRLVSKSVGWQDRSTGERRFGRVTSAQTEVRAVWNGVRWVSQERFDLRYAILKELKS